MVLPLATMVMPPLVTVPLLHSALNMATVALATSIVQQTHTSETPRLRPWVALFRPLRCVCRSDAMVALGASTLRGPTALQHA